MGNDLPTVNTQQGQQDTYTSETQYIIHIIRHLFVAGHTSRANVNKRSERRVLCIFYVYTLPYLLIGFMLLLAVRFCFLRYDMTRFVVCLLNSVSPRSLLKLLLLSHGVFTHRISRGLCY